MGCISAGRGSVVLARARGPKSFVTSSHAASRKNVFLGTEGGGLHLSWPHKSGQSCLGTLM